MRIGGSCRAFGLLLLLGQLAGPAVGGSADTLRVMSFNLRYGTAADGENAWGLRQELLLETIRAFDPDLLGTQECLAAQADFLQANLPGHEFVGVGRDDGRQAGEMCAVFFRASRLEKLDEGHFWLSESPEVVASRDWDAALTRMATWARLRVRANGQEIVLINTHFDHVGRDARRKSAELLRRRAGEIARGASVILTGDFNAPAEAGEEGPYRVLVAGGSAAGSGFVDSFRRLHPEPLKDEGTFHGFAGGTIGARIDWILVSPEVEVMAAAIDRTRRDGRFPSDHFPVTAVVGLRAPAPAR